MLLFMKGIERAPFSGEVTRLGAVNSADSIVMLLHSKTTGRDYVLKWNRSYISSLEEAAEIVVFSRKSLDLYRAVLGEKYIVPTEFVIGEKQDQHKLKVKVYEVQPYISGWDGRSLPEDLRRDERLVDSWRKLYSRVSLLYIIGNNVNRQLRKQGGVEFPINLTLGTSRKAALFGSSELLLHDIPQTPNLLIDRVALRLHLCDFGPYTPWNKEMQAAYQEIYDRSLLASKSLEGPPLE